MSEVSCSEQTSSRTSWMVEEGSTTTHPPYIPKSFNTTIDSFHPISYPIKGFSLSFNFFFDSSVIPPLRQAVRISQDILLRLGLICGQIYFARLQGRAPWSSRLRFRQVDRKRCIDRRCGDHTVDLLTCGGRYVGREIKPWSAHPPGTANGLPKQSTNSRAPDHR